MKTKFKIEKNIPLAQTQKRREQVRYPFREMEIGDSFIIAETYTRDTMQLKGNAARNWARKSGDCTTWKFSCRKTKDGKIRIWRIA